MIIKTLEELGRALDNDERVEVEWYGEFRELRFNESWVLSDLKAKLHSGKIRIAPKMTFIEGKGGRFEYPEPVTESPTLEVECWLVCITASDMAVPIKPTEFDFDSLFSKGLVHLTKEAAEQHANAILKAMGVYDE